MHLRRKRSMTLKTITLAVLIVGCNLEDDTKNACNATTDCLTGYQCVNNVCTGGNNGGVDAPNGPYYGSVEAMTPVSSGMAAANYDTLVAATTVAGTLGCAVVGDLQASPGAGAVMYAMV